MGAGWCFPRRRVRRIRRCISRTSTSDGNSSPAILIDNATASNRAVNIPEFVNIAGDGIEDIQVPAVEQYKLMDEAMDLEEKGKNDQALAIWKKAVAMDPDNAKAQNGLGISLYVHGDTRAGLRASPPRHAASIRCLLKATMSSARSCLKQGAVPRRQCRNSRRQSPSGRTSSPQRRALRSAYQALETTLRRSPTGARRTSSIPAA